MNCVAFERTPSSALTRTGQQEEHTTHVL